MDTEYTFFSGGFLKVTNQSIFQKTYIKIDDIGLWSINETTGGYMVVVVYGNRETYLYFYGDGSIIKAETFCEKLLSER